MYYPYLRGKQFELILLRENAEFIAESKIHPIIEPVKEDFKALARALKVIDDNSVNYSIIINPITGEKPIKTSRILKELIQNNCKDFTNLSFAYILHPESRIEDLMTLLDKYNDIKFSIIHYGYSNSKEIANKIKDYNNINRHIFIDGFAGKLYQRNLRKDGISRILIRDGFKTQRKNSLYPKSEHFSDLHITYPDEGMDGFGDYLTVGDTYSEAGGPAYAVAIHLTYLNDDDMFIYHFLSVRTDSPTDPGGKFLEAIDKLVSFTENRDSLIFKSNAYLEFKDLYDKQHYPGLGYVKKLSMQHHIELIANFLKQS